MEKKLLLAGSKLNRLDNPSDSDGVSPTHNNPSNEGCLRWQLSERKQLIDEGLIPRVEPPGYRSAGDARIESEKTLNLSVVMDNEARRTDLQM